MTRIACQFCGRAFGDQRALTWHIDASHPQTFDVESGWMTEVDYPPTSTVLHRTRGGRGCVGEAIAKSRRKP